MHPKLPANPSKVRNGGLVELGKDTYTHTKCLYTRNVYSEENDVTYLASILLKSNGCV